ncbi:cytochrome c [Alphaproteobacteria bacterium GH1-50]|uniref:Cytochrome c n=1 Tax=Kangsaoukella pontilimi TaxID=2691042 RepID=A0A7C9ML26_9RHOB|nr:cytochrome c [Kangsaoukella pontilimi]MXQ08895.1 cytochrome c [Kangsaoukella pontilimi]
MRTGTIIAALSLTIASAAFAHSGVKDPQVKAWMENMKSIATETKTLGQMARGMTPFDRDAAEAALASLEAHAARIPDVFARPAEDPLSEAQPTIWTEPEDFTRAATALRSAARLPVETADDLRAAMGAIGSTCKECHGRYRQ